MLVGLRAIGVATALDDFGAGHAGLAHLKELHVDVLKIDRSFVMNMDGCEDDAVIVRSTIDLGRNLGLDVVAEGVETQEIWNKLRELGCKTAQGYFLSRPVPPEQLAEWLVDRRGDVAPGADEAAA